MKRGCLFWAGAVAAFWLLGILVAKLLPLGDEPRNGAERLYHQNAVEMRHYMNSNPIAGLLSRLLVYRISVGGLQEVANSCEGASVSGLESHANVVAQVVDHSIYGIPIRFYQVSCSGNYITGGLADYSPRPPSRPMGQGQEVELDEPWRQPPPPPPPPGVSPPPEPSAPSGAPR